MHSLVSLIPAQSCLFIYLFQYIYTGYHFQTNLFFEMAHVECNSCSDTAGCWYRVTSEAPGAVPRDRDTGPPDWAVSQSHVTEPRH